jgi:hypothetical protein
VKTLIIAENVTAGKLGVRPATLTTALPQPVVAKEAVNQVDANRMKAVGARRVHHGLHHLERPDAIDRPLHDRIEILHAEA